jgi:hypothetical protein
MGLDMYLTVRKEGEEKEEIGYWRKHHDLHGWMSDLWERKGYPLPEEWDEERRAAQRHPLRLHRPRRRAGITADVADRDLALQLNAVRAHLLYQLREAVTRVGR